MVLLLLLLFLLFLLFLLLLLHLLLLLLLPLLPRNDYTQLEDDYKRYISLVDSSYEQMLAATGRLEEFNGFNICFLGNS